MSTALAASISSPVRRRMKTGLPRHLTVIWLPASSALMSTRMVASASTSALGFIWSISGQTAAAPPTAPVAAVAT